ncbi:unnamed protein product [Paramecium sonneborni]|uniref:Transmembrane protein n=1 Tax=Paramecium sonneborni TaxID=65129 RepID=A0A8S1KYB3_9CILI|nr:unnamed protein product [Paramecium sonneborni]CAD8060580.1 unnamed protein product [Paramecium sonneborni]
MDSKTRQQAAWLTLISSAVIGGSFYYFSSQEELYESEDCLKLRNYAHNYSIFCITFAIFIILIWVTSKLIKDEGCNSGIDCIQLLSGIVGVVFIILFAYGLYLQEPCGELRTFTVIYLIIISILFCCGCCGMCCALGSLKQ